MTFFFKSFPLFFVFTETELICNAFFFLQFHKNTCLLHKTHLIWKLREQNVKDFFDLIYDFLLFL